MFRQDRHEPACKREVAGYAPTVPTYGVTPGSTWGHLAMARSQTAKCPSHEVKDWGRYRAIDFVDERLEITIDAALFA